MTYGTTPDFLDHFGLESIKDLPGMDELKAAGLLQSDIPDSLRIPTPNDADALAPDEDPLDEEGADEELAAVQAGEAAATD